MPPTRARVQENGTGREARTESGQQSTRISLSPDGYWFHENSLSTAITKDLKAHYLQPCTSWRNAPQEHREWWWRAFTTQYTWAEELEATVYKKWKLKASERLRDMVSKATKIPETDPVPWLPSPLREQLKAFRDDSKFKKRSRQNSINKLTGPKKGSVHTSGSVSAEKIARRMAIRDNNIPAASDVFVEIHTRKEGTETVFCDKRAESVWDEFQRLKLNASQSGTQVTDNELFFQAAGGMNKKGLVYGLGSHSEVLYERPAASRSSSSASTSYAPSMFAQLFDRLQKTENELSSTKEEVTKTRAALAKLESRFESSN